MPLLIISEKDEGKPPQYDAVGLNRDRPVLTVRAIQNKITGLLMEIAPLRAHRIQAA